MCSGETVASVITGVDEVSAIQKLLKLRKMSADEVRVRIGSMLRKRRERGLWRRGLHKSADAFDAERLLEAVAELVPGTCRAEVEKLEREHPETFAAMATRAASTAEAVLSGAWELLGHPVDLRGNVDWHRDPRSGHCWPRAFYADLSLNSHGDDEIDVKYVWELGRHQYLVELARGWLFTGNKQYADRSRELILDWIRSSPLYEGVHWTSALEVAMRGISWLWTIATMSEWDGWREGDLEQMAASLADHATYLEHHLSLYSSPYNHLVGEATALYLIGIALGQAEHSSRWRCLGRKILATRGPRQFYDDGFTVEQATGYHFYTIGFMTLAVAAARKEGKPFETLEPVLHQAYRAGVALRRPDGCWPAIGDLDSARSIPVHPDDFWDFNSLCSLGAALFDDPQLNVSDSAPGEELYWLMGCEGIKSLTGLASACSDGCTVLPESGYAVARRGNDWLLFDAGPLGDGLHPDATPSTAHGHADALQVLFNMAGKQVLLDSGIPFYAGTGSSDWIRHFRSAAAHNTLEIEGAAMARPAGKLEWSHVQAPPKLNANLTEEVWLARGCAKWGRGILVERNLLGLPGKGLWIADWIETTHPRRVRWFWQLPAGTLLGQESNGPQSCVVRGEDLVVMTWSESAHIRARLEVPSENSPVARNAPGYGVPRAGQRLLQETEPATRLFVVTYVGTSVPTAMGVSREGKHLACAINHKDQTRLGQHVIPNGEEYDAAITWRLRTEQGPVTYLAGAAPDRADSKWTFLTGSGGWPAAMCDRIPEELPNKVKVI